MTAAHESSVGERDTNDFGIVFVVEQQATRLHLPEPT